MNGIWLVSYIALWILVFLLAVIVLGLIRQLGLIHIRLGLDHILTPTEGLKIGSPAPDFQTVDAISQKDFTLNKLKGSPCLLIFVSPTCGPCLELMPHVISFWKAKHKKLDIVLFSPSEKITGLDLKKVRFPVLMDPKGTIMEMYQVRATPFAYRLDDSGIVKRRGILNNYEDLDAFLGDPPSTETRVEIP